MKKIHVILSGLLINVFFIQTRDVQETVLRAHKLYEQNEFEQARDLYNLIEKKGPATWYNLGNCHYKLDNHLNALICWRRAERDATWSEFPALYHNMNEAQKKLGIELSFKDSLARSVRRLLSLFSLFGWQIIFLLVWTMLLLLLGYLARTQRYLVLSSLSLLLVVCMSTLYIKFDFVNARNGIVTDKTLVVYSGPDKGFHELGSLCKTNEVTILEENNEWLKIQDNNLVGWIPESTVAQV